LREVPISNTTQTGYACREGHTGHLCAVCERKFAYQGVFCSKCAPGSEFQEWSTGKAVALLLFGLIILLGVTFLLFFLPICPRLEEMLKQLVAPAVNRVGEVVSGLVARRSRASAGRLSADMSASVRLSAQSGAAHDHLHPRLHLHGRPNSPLHLASASKRIGGKEALTPQARGAERGKRKLAAVLDVISEPLRIIVRCAACSCGRRRHAHALTLASLCPRFAASGKSSRASTTAWRCRGRPSTVRLPSPSPFPRHSMLTSRAASRADALSSALSVVSVQLLRLPNIACIQPSVSFYVYATPPACVRLVHSCAKR
jgi:hypothetical protein